MRAAACDLGGLEQRNLAHFAPRRLIDDEFRAAIVDFLVSEIERGVFIDPESGNYDEMTAYQWLRNQIHLPDDDISQLVGQAFERFSDE